MWRKVVSPPTTAVTCVHPSTLALLRHRARWCSRLIVQAPMGPVLAAATTAFGLGVWRAGAAVEIFAGGVRRKFGRCKLRCMCVGDRSGERVLTTYFYVEVHTYGRDEIRRKEAMSLIPTAHRRYVGAPYAPYGEITTSTHSRAEFSGNPTISHRTPRRQPELLVQLTNPVQTSPASAAPQFAGAVLRRALPHAAAERVASLAVIFGLWERCCRRR